MSELTDDQLDGLFRKSAEEFDPPFDPAAWRDMKTRLDANDQTTGGALIWKKLLRWGLPMGLLLLLSSGGWYAYRTIHPAIATSGSKRMTKAKLTLNRNAEDQPTESPTFTDKLARTTTTVGSKESEAGKQPTDRVASVAIPTESENRFNKPITRLETKPVSGVETATKRAVPAYKSLKAERNRLSNSRLDKPATRLNKDVASAVSYPSNRKNLPVSGSVRKQRRAPTGRYGASLTTTNYAVISNAPFGKRPVSGNQEVMSGNRAEVSGSTNIIANSEAETIVLPALSELTIRPAKWPKLSFTDRAVIAHPDTTLRSVVPKLPSERGLSVRFVVAPDLSSIGLKNFSRPGTNIGGLLEYRLARRWSVQAGVIQSTKIYRALPEDYTVPTGTWKGGGKPENVDGLCNMLDIPINLRYDIIVKPQAGSRWFVSSGVTSYVMEKENYDYNYAAHTYPYPKTYGVDTTTGGYGFSTLNLSIGYERSFSRRLSWQVEPFIKVPLKGVGYFKTNLMSTGAFFSIRYKLTKTK